MQAIMRAILSRVSIVLWSIILVANKTSFNSNRLRKILLSESSASIEEKVEMFKECLWVHELNKNRETEGEYHTLFLN
jgi:hypothetical protein